MPLFSRRSRAASNSTFNTGHAGDDELLGIIAQRSDLNAPRHWVHYLYFPDEASARSWSGSIEAAGWTLRTVAPAAVDDGSWVVMPERHDVVLSPDAVRDARTYFDAIAAQVESAEYDGWEASL